MEDYIPAGLAAASTQLLVAIRRTLLLAAAPLDDLAPWPADPAAPLANVKLAVILALVLAASAHTLHTMISRWPGTPAAPIYASSPPTPTTAETPHGHL